MATYDGMNFAAKLKLLMKQHRYSQNDVAARVDVSQSLVSMWTTGKSVPAMYEAARLAKLLNVDVEFLADDAQDEPAPAEFTEGERAIIELIRAMRLERQEALRRLAIPIESGRSAVARAREDMRLGEVLSGQAALDAIAKSTPVTDPLEVIDETPKRSDPSRSRRKA